MFSRLMTLIGKELIILLRDKPSRMIVIVPVLLQLAVFPFAATLEVTNARIGIFNEDAGAVSIELIQRLATSKSFSKIELFQSAEAAEEALNNQKILLLIRFSPEFSRYIQDGRPAPIQVIIDGRRSNGGQIAEAYIQSIIAGYQKERTVGLQQKALHTPLHLEFRNWYNPNLDYKWFVVPTLIALITTVGVLVVTALSVAREREQGTLEQLRVSPLSTGEIFVGKAVPALIIAFLQGSTVLAGGVFAYGIPFSVHCFCFIVPCCVMDYRLLG